jgi:hypothetical protein
MNVYQLNALHIILPYEHSDPYSRRGFVIIQNRKELVSYSKTTTLTKHPSGMLVLDMDTMK